MMKNKDMPAMPQSFSMSEENAGTAKTHLADDEAKEASCLTKREMFAMHAMQGLLANSGGPVQSSPMSGFHFCNGDESGVAKLSVYLADALLKELEK